jgi:hypothetical protein
MKNGGCTAESLIKKTAQCEFLVAQCVCVRLKVGVMGESFSFIVITFVVIENQITLLSLSFCNNVFNLYL